MSHIEDLSRYGIEEFLQSRSPKKQRLFNSGSLETRQNGFQFGQMDKFVSQLQEFYPYCIEDGNGAAAERMYRENIHTLTAWRQNTFPRMLSAPVS
ncbi:hypothetical protein TNCV_2101181 [Trichonephila clavipes]|nr:hypothetical protein TNCV_2101181 [Trichonephila clavipes]